MSPLKEKLSAPERSNPGAARAKLGQLLGRWGAALEGKVVTVHPPMEPGRREVWEPIAKDTYELRGVESIGVAHPSAVQPLTTKES